ncbi:MAG TPA: metallophosphoesterase family protein [Candidatus Methanoperedens sp.]
MKIAALGDIHGNIEALKVAYDTVMPAGVDRIYHLGDLGGYAPFVNEVVDFVIEHGIYGVQGNYDLNVARDSEHCGCKYEDPVQAELADKSFEWTKQHATRKSKDFMISLPASISFTAEGKQVMIFHAAPHKNNLYWYEDRPDKFFLEMAGKTRADIMIYGHTHKPYRKDIMGKVFINAGSVGKPKDGDPRACLTIIDISKQDVGHEFLRVPYDIEKVVSAIISSGLPPALAEKLREAG